MNPQGHVEMDVALFVATCLTAGVHLYCLRAWMRQREGIGAGLLLRLAGWLVLSSRFGTVLWEKGDLPVTVPGAIAIFLLCAGDVSGMLSRGKKP